MINNHDRNYLIIVTEAAIRLRIMANDDCSNWLQPVEMDRAGRKPNHSLVRSTGTLLRSSKVLNKRTREAAAIEQINQFIINFIRKLIGYREFVFDMCAICIRMHPSVFGIGASQVAYDSRRNARLRGA